MKKAVRLRGMRGVVHALRGREGNRLDTTRKEKVMKIIKEKYADFGPTLIAEKLRERKTPIGIHPTTIRGYMMEHRLWKPKKRKTNGQHREWRPRRSMFGEMQQFDGSYHKWFEERGDELCLLAAIDDATGRITRLQFAENEGVVCVDAFWKKYVETLGKPKEIYLDKFSTYKINHKNAVDNKDMITQFERTCTELDIRLLTAHSPQAKGRVERLFQTLQDRLVKELRLRGISDISLANAFLEKEFIAAFNEKFSVLAQTEGDAHRKLAEKEASSLDSVFSIRSERRVNNDFTVRFKNIWYQLTEEQPTTVLRKDGIVIEERLDYSTHFLLRGKELNVKALPKRPERTKEKVTALAPKMRSVTKPASNHPWRFFTKETREKMKVGVR